MFQEMATLTELDFIDVGYKDCLMTLTGDRTLGDLIMVGCKQPDNVMNYGPEIGFLVCSFVSI